MSEITREMAEAESIHRNMIAARSDVPKLLVQRTEAEWREEFEAYADKQGLYLDTRGIYFTFWLAALRLVNAIKEDGK